MQLGHRHCLATILHSRYLFVMIKYVLWRFNHNYLESKRFHHIYYITLPDSKNGGVK